MWSRFRSLAPSRVVESSVCALAHGWGPDTSTPLVLLQFRAATGLVGIVSLPADLAQMLVDDAMTPR